MACKNMVMIMIVGVLVGGCQSSPCQLKSDSYYSQVVKIGKSADLTGLSNVVEKWKEVKSEIVSHDERKCIHNNLSLDKLVYYDVLPISRLKLSASGIQHNLTENNVTEVFVLSFTDPCGSDSKYSANPEWFLAETKEGMELIDFVHIME